MFGLSKAEKRLKEVEARVEIAEARRRSAEVAANRAVDDAAKLTGDLQSAIKRASEAEAKIRQQNEADLLMVSIQITKRIVEGEKKESPVMATLLGQQASLQAMSPYASVGYGDYYGLGGALSGLGLGAFIGQQGAASVYSTHG